MKKGDFQFLICMWMIAIPYACIIAITKDIFYIIAIGIPTLCGVSVIALVTDEEE